MYISTRDNYSPVKAAEAIKMGMVPKGGLFVPKFIPSLNESELLNLVGASYQEVAAKILSLFLDDYTQEEIHYCIDKAYGNQFQHPKITPLYKLKDNTYVLELWHGPTAAFKDMALQMLPQLFSLAKEKVKSSRETLILVATSGDTGKAALEGFKNVSGTKIIVFYPQQGVSKMQELQMTTTDGDNTYVVAVKGNFDDCQSAVKEIFSNDQFQNILAQEGYELSSANSINWGRLLPQIVYYIYSYLELLFSKKINFGDKINFVVPTGNFGNILAAWYAGKMGLPIHKLICASNENKILTDFFTTGEYNRNRLFKRTISPSMDILISSNLERFLFEMTQHNGEKIAFWMNSLQKKGHFVVDNQTFNAIKEVLQAGFASEEETRVTIKKYFTETGYALDPHTAVGVKVYDEYVKDTNDAHLTVIDATASPFKFNTSVMEAIKGIEAVKGKDEFSVLDDLSKLIAQPIHPGLKDLDQKPVLHKRVCAKEKMKEEIEDMLEFKKTPQK